MKRKTALFLALLLTAALLAGCQSGTSNTSPTDGAGDSQQGTGTAPESTTDSGEGTKHLTLASLEWRGTDTYQVKGTESFQTLSMDSLLLYQADGTYVTNIAESYSISEDGKTLTFTIPSDFKYYDGTPLTPEDVKRSFEWGLEVSDYSEDYDGIESMEIQGNDLIIHLEAYSPATIFSIAGAFMPIIPSAQLDSMSAEELLWGARPYGAFYLEEYVEGSHVTLKRNEYYKTNNPNVQNKGPVHVETVTVRFINDDFALTNSVVAGEIDATFIFSSLMLGELRKNTDITPLWLMDFQVWRLFFNDDYEQLADPNVREALMLLIDREGLSEYSEGLMSPAYSYSVPGMNDYAAEAERYIQDQYGFSPEKAQQMLADAGWSDTDGDGYLDKDGAPLSFTVNYMESSFAKIVVEYLQIRYREFGVRMELQALERPPFTVAIETDRSYQASLNGFSWGDTSATLPYLISDKNILADNAYFELCAQAAIDPDDEARISKYAQAQQILADSRSCVPVVRRNGLFVYNSEKLKDLVLDDIGNFFLNDVK